MPQKWSSHGQSGRTGAFTYMYAGSLCCVTAQIVGGQRLTSSIFVAIPISLCLLSLLITWLHSFLHYTNCQWGMKYVVHNAHGYKIWTMLYQTTLVLYICSVWCMFYGEEMNTLIQGRTVSFEFMSILRWFVTPLILSLNRAVLVSKHSLFMFDIQ